MVGFSERWFPDAYVFVLLAGIVVAVATLVHGGGPLAISMAFGDGFWSLIPFTMQMALVAIGGYVVAKSPPVAALMPRAAGVPKTGRGAVVFVGVVSILLSLVNWGVSLIFSGLLVRQIARRNDIRLDYRAAGAGGYLGLGFGFTLRHQFVGGAVAGDGVEHPGLADADHRHHRLRGNDPDLAVPGHHRGGNLPVGGDLLLHDAVDESAKTAG